VGKGIGRSLRIDNEDGARILGTAFQRHLAWCGKPEWEDPQRSVEKEYEGRIRDQKGFCKKKLRVTDSITQ